MPESLARGRTASSVMTMPEVFRLLEPDLDRFERALDSIERGLSRIELLLPFVDGSDRLEPSYEIRAVIAAVGRGLVAGRSFVQLMSDNLRLLARKVSVEEIFAPNAVGEFKI